MKLLSFRHNGKDTYGVVSGNGVIDLGKRLGANYPDLKTLIAKGGLDEAKKAATGAADAPLDAIEFLPVIPNPGKIICVGLNYKAHREETGRKPTDNPALFIRFADSQTGHKQ